MEQLYKHMADTDLSSFGLTSSDNAVYDPNAQHPSLESTEGVSTPNPNYNPPKLPVTPSTVNITTGNGVPGGFDCSSIKSPTSATTNASLAISAIMAEASAVTAVISAIKAGLIPSVPGIMGASSKLAALQTKAANKLNAAKSAPDFSKSYILPSPPTIPAVPNFASAGIPTLPKLPSVSL